MDGKPQDFKDWKEWYSLKEAQKVLDVTYRTVRYYREQYKEHSKGEGRDIRVSHKFIDLVRKNRKTNTNRISDSKTKKEYKAELEELREKYQKAIKEQRGIYEKRLDKFKGYDYDEETERIEIFTHEEYEAFEKALNEWKLQKVRMEEQQKAFEQTVSSKDELIEMYKNQADYQRKQSDRILTQMDKLIEAIKRRDAIEAVEKKVIGKRHDL